MLLPKAVYSFLEVRKAGEKCQSGGNKYVGAGKAIIQIDDVLVPGSNQGDAAHQYVGEGER
jgi:hypothetical protein